MSKPALALVCARLGWDFCWEGPLVTSELERTFFRFLFFNVMPQISNLDLGKIIIIKMKNGWFYSQCKVSQWETHFRACLKHPGSFPIFQKIELG